MRGRIQRHAAERVLPKHWRAELPADNTITPVRLDVTKVAVLRGGAGMSFADGHAELHRWVEETTVAPEGMVIPRVHTSPTDRDMQWLQQRATVGR
jgi:prepilin-type processing-associated H-X9-DG protein